MQACVPRLRIRYIQIPQKNFLLLPILLTVFSILFLVFIMWYIFLFRCVNSLKIEMAWLLKKAKINHYAFSRRVNYITLFVFQQINCSFHTQKNVIKLVKLLTESVLPARQQKLLLYLFRSSITTICIDNVFKWF